MGSCMDEFSVNEVGGGVIKGGDILVRAVELDCIE